MTSENVSPTPGNTGALPSRAGSISPTRSPTGGTRHCPECGAAVINRSAARCWLCEAPLPAVWDDSVVPRDWVDASEPRPTNALRVILGVMLLFLGVGLAGVAPGVLIVLLLILPPVLIRTTRSGADGAGGGIAGFFSTLAVVALIGLAAIATFFVTCFAICGAGATVGAFNTGGSGEGLLLLSMTTGAVAAVFVLTALIRRLRRRGGGA